MDWTAALLIFSRSQPMETVVSRRHSRQNRDSTSIEVCFQSGGAEPTAPQASRVSTPQKTSQTVMNLSNVISMDDRITRNQSARTGVRDRRYAIRFPFAADVEL